MMGCFFTITSHDGLFFTVTSCDGLFSETAVGWLRASFSLPSTHTTCASNPPYTSYQQEQPSLDADPADCGQCGQWTPCLQPKTWWALGARKQASGLNIWHFSWLPEKWCQWPLCPAGSHNGPQVKRLDGLNMWQRRTFPSAGFMWFFHSYLCNGILFGIKSELKVQPF